MGGTDRQRKERSMKLEKILVPLDGSALAEAALPKAVEMAESSGAKLLLIRAAEAHTLPGADPTEAQIKVVREAEDYLAQVGDRLAALGLKDVETSVWYGPAAYAIVEAARLNKVDLTAMTTHGRGGPGRPLAGRGGAPHGGGRGRIGAARNPDADPPDPRGRGAGPGAGGKGRGQALAGPCGREGVGRVSACPRSPGRLAGGGGDSPLHRADRRSAGHGGPAGPRGAADL